ncbi:FeoB-associated Cys-rich membrane protein [Neptunitalea chrysea]|nr:FeoB-associated Cys-rich membrane protein [Neptunitalea chrysea]
MMQEILVYVSVLAALFYLFYKYNMPKRQKSVKNSGCGKDNCGCH